MQAMKIVVSALIIAKGTYLATEMLIRYGRTSTLLATLDLITVF